MWVKIDDGFATHPKVLRAGILALGLQIRAICYASQNKTDGFLPTEAIPLLSIGMDPIDWPAHMVRHQLWECRREGDILGLYQRKNNLGAKHDAIGFTLQVNDESCIITTADLADDPVLSTQLPLPARIEALLKKGPALTPSQIASELNAKLDTVRRTLTRGKDHRWLQLSAKGGGRSSVGDTAAEIVRRYPWVMH